MRFVAERLREPVSHSRRHFNLSGVVTQQFLGGGKFPGFGFLRRGGGQLFLLLRAMFGFLFHTASGGFGKVNGKGFSRAMQFTTDSIGSLFSECGDFFITQLVIRYEQQEQAVFFG